MWGLLRDIVARLSPLCYSGSGSGQPPPESTSNEQETVRENGDGDLENDDAVRWRILEATSYEQFKRAPKMSTDLIRLREQAMQDAKRVLQGWIPNRGDEEWGVEVLIDPGKKKS